LNYRLTVSRILKRFWRQCGTGAKSSFTGQGVLFFCSRLFCGF